jgi:hypothetical protein
MARSEVVSAVYDRLEAMWTQTVVRRMNEFADDASEPTPFVMPQFPFATPARLTLGNPPYYRETGGIRLMLNVLRGTKIEDATALANDLADLFRDTVFNGVRTQTPSSPMLGNENEVSSYFAMAVIVPYYFDWQEADE